MTYVYGLISIGGVALLHNNPNTLNNPVLQAVFQSPTLGGTLYTEYPVYNSDRVVNAQWDFMEINVYKSIEGLKENGGNMPYTDELGFDWLVKMPALTYNTIIGDNSEMLVTQVQMTLWIVAGPANTPFS